MKKQSRACEFNSKEREKIRTRDHNQCIFCSMNYCMEKAQWFDLSATSIMHYIPRSKGGLGIEQNGAVGCQWHHHMLDNGRNGKRKEMLELFREYLERYYPEWDERKITYDYKKWGFLKNVYQDKRIEENDERSL